MSKFFTQTPLMIAVWCIITSIMFLTLLSSIFVNIYFNKQYKNKKIFSPKKITIIATFLSILIIQTTIDVFIPSIPGVPSFESMTTITVGFLFGPIEGIIFGWIADTLIVLIHGWSYQLTPSLMMPMIGLIAGITGIIYKNKDEMKKWKTIVLFQATLLILMLLMLVTTLTLVDVVGDYGVGHWYAPNAEKMASLTPISTVVTILLVEIIFFFLIKSKKSSRDLFLFSMVLVASILERILELGIRPFTQAYYNEGMDYFIELYIRLLRSTYLIPVVAITSFGLIRATMFVLDYNLDNTKEVQKYEDKRLL